MDDHHKVKFSTGFAMNILIHVIMLFSFLSLFFFLYVSKVEEDAFKNEFGNIIETNLNEFIENNKILKPEIKDLSPCYPKSKICIQAMIGQQKNVIFL